ncbi:MAG: hypothetical protein R3181_15835, partial [Rubricoccaceae bacterium]|nr:hypothetical protein [Rubricoccaceae bacterium]
MNFFLHYIGVEGAARDFPKTVFTDRPTGLVIERVPDVHPGKAFLLTRLGDAFPEGRWNCWGVPDGAGPAIGRLSEGDLFLLMETSSGPGAVPAMGRVETFVPQRFPHLSNALWGERGFPYIFFFRTIPLALTWIDLGARLGYKPTYDGPRGQVQRIREEHVRHAGGVRALERWLYSKEDREAVDRFSLNPRRLVRESPELYDVQAEHDALITTSIEDEPELTDDVDAREVTSYSYP